MRLTHPDYTMLVMQAYREKRANNELSLLLAQSTPAKIRQACLHVYKEHYDKKEHQILRKDEQVLRDFFGPGESGKQFLQLIREFGTDKFRPLDNYLKGNTEKTDNTNLELLAWLINFQHRPYSFDKNFQLTDEELLLLTNNDEKQSESVADKNGLEENNEAQETFLEKETGNVAVQIEDALGVPFVTGEKNDKAKIKNRRAAVIFLMLIICTAGVYAVWQQTQIVGNGNTVCVYWAGDHYEKAPCDEKSKGRLIIPMNPEKVRSFRKITQEDTITEWSVGKLYYIKDSNTIKLYTEAGSYPENLNRTLKVLSSYVFENHLRKKETFGKDSLVKQDTKFLNNK
jgi:hypothetical protein